MNTLTYSTERFSHSPEASISALLDSDAIDLAEISQAIRDNPGLSALVVKMSESLALSPTAPSGTVEEAAVVLGKNRLRVLVSAWSLAESRGTFRCEDSESGDSPEVLYLSSFFRWLGFAASPETAAPALFSSRARAPEPVAGLTDMLMRDVISLIPYVEPVLLNSIAQPKTALDARGPARGDTTE